MQKAKKQGFTLAELICALAIIGICTALAATTINPSTKITKYGYMNAYQSLEKAYYNAMINGCNPFKTISLDPNNPIIHSENEDTGTKEICRGLSAYFNNKISACDNAQLTNVLANEDDFTDDTLQIETVNNYRFYITKQLSNDENTFKFYIVFIDINGIKPPNSITYTFRLNRPEIIQNRIDPDIFAFALMENGRICPLGIPEYDRNIMAVGVSYMPPGNDAVASNYTDRAFTLMEAKSVAWGYYSLEKEPSKQHNMNENLSMNDYIRSLLPQNSNIIQNFPVNYDTFENFPIAANRPYNCSLMNYEQCSVFPFTYHR